MNRRIPVLLITGSLALTGCGNDSNSSRPATTGGTPSNAPTTVEGSSIGTPRPSASPGRDELRAAVQAYSDAFPDGRATAAYDMFTARCKQRITRSQFTGIVQAAKQLYGKALPIKTYSAEVSGNLARVTYTYDVPALDQTKEPWTRENGVWKQDDC
jgi:hypothetical protein